MALPEVIKVMARAVRKAELKWESTFNDDHEEWLAARQEWYRLSKELDRLMADHRGSKP